MQAWNKGATHFAGIAKLQTRPQICCDSMCLAPEPWNSSAQGQHAGLKNGLRILFGETLLLRISDGRTSTGFICDRGLDYKITSYDRHKAALGVWAVGGQWHDLPPAFSSMITPHDCSAWFGRTIEPFAICTVMPTWRLQVFAECHWSDIFPLSSFSFSFSFKLLSCSVVCRAVGRLIAGGDFDTQLTLGRCGAIQSRHSSASLTRSIAWRSEIPSLTVRLILKTEARILAWKKPRSGNAKILGASHKLLWVTIRSFLSCCSNAKWARAGLVPAQRRHYRCTGENSERNLRNNLATKASKVTRRRVHLKQHIDSVLHAACRWEVSFSTMIGMHIMLWHPGILYLSHYQWQPITAPQKYMVRRLLEYSRPRLCWINIS